MIVILRRNEVIHDSVLAQADLVVRKQKLTYRVLKSRTTKRKVMRPEEILDAEQTK